MHLRTTLKIVDDINVIVPNSLNLMTTYVLREQGDWFEEEIKFVRMLLKPGQKAIDIGANYGLFTLSMAKVVGPFGNVWAFEPASSTAAFLSDSLAINGFHQVTLDQRALSEKAGTAQLSLNDNSELNELIRCSAAVGISETVALISLDDAMAQYGWNDIAFVKIDAEGEEAAILRGGVNFFHELSPLIQYEVKAGGVVHIELVRAFEDIGYASYRLVPGLNALIPFDVGTEIDDFLLNLFCCKPDRAAKLAAAGQLVLIDEVMTTSTITQSDDRLIDLCSDSAYSWQNKLTALPYAAHLCESWLQTVREGKSVAVEQALALHAVAHDSKVPLSKRLFALQTSLDILTAICNADPKFLRYASLARIAREFGSRVVALSALSSLFDLAKKSKQINPTEPFLATSERFDTVDPKSAMGSWIACSILEEIEKSSSYSSFYTGLSALQRLKAIQLSNFGSPEMVRRLALIQERFGKESQ